MYRLFYLLITAIFSSSFALSQTQYDWVNSIHTSLGVPFDADTTNDYIIVRPQYVLSYNAQKGVPNWVAWQMNASWFGDVPRYTGNFITDTSLPSGMYRVKHSDYTNSGYDRGHMVRSEERTKTVEDNKSTFILTSILPQQPDLNQGVWLDFEYHLEKMCKEQSVDLYVYSGGVFNSDSTLKSEGKVAVPDSCFKVVFVCGSGSIIPYDTLAVMMPNIDGIRSDDWKKYETTLERVEWSSGYTFSRKPVGIIEQNDNLIIHQNQKEICLLGSFNYHVYDMMGSTISNGLSDRISTENLTSGIYYIKLQSEVRKMIIKYLKY